jgi:LDH2 family malate/lactate/ureidoglycolate dehydrogenase
VSGRYAAGDLRDFAERVLGAHGLAREHAVVTARHLVEADLLGYATHGVDLVPIYIDALEQGAMARAAEPTVLRDDGASIVWDGNLVSGQVLISRAVEEGLARLDDHGLVTVSVKRSHHTGCHATHLTAATDRSAIALITAGSTVGKRIAPFGATSPVFSPAPFAVGIPTGGEPILIDMTMASTANSVVRQHHQRAARLPHPWLITHDGHPTDDAGALYARPPGTILPLGGLDNGHKGFALILLIEALTVALGGGVDRRDSDDGVESQTVFVWLIDPARFGGAEAFLGHMDAIAERCLAARPRPGGEIPRLPGRRSLQRRREGLARGVPLGADVVGRLVATGEAAGVTFPPALGD